MTGEVGFLLSKGTRKGTDAESILLIPSLAKGRAVKYDHNNCTPNSWMHTLQSGGKLQGYANIRQISSKRQKNECIQNDPFLQKG